MAFSQDHSPQIGEPEPLCDGLRVITAPNASPMTFTGTRTYLLGLTSLAVIDPGPANEAHLGAILASVQPGQSISHILVTHPHLDHSPLAGRLAALTGAKVMAFGASHAGRSSIMTKLAETAEIGGGEGIDTDFTPHIPLADGQTIEADDWTLEAIHTPGHQSSHLSFRWQDKLFSGDHVMGWASTLISPPDGDLTQFMTSLERLKGQGFTRFFPGHGQVVETPETIIDHLLTHRRSREADILERLQDGPATPRALTRMIYTDVPQALHGAAERNVLAHLIDLTDRGVAKPMGDLSPSSLFRLIPQAKP